jgi:hypothetical protein
MNKKPLRKIVMSIYIETELLMVITARAKKNRRSVNGEIIRMIEESLGLV